MSNKKDLTRIEDLSEFLHELEKEATTIRDFSGEFPELPSEESEESSFSSDFSSDDQFTLSESEETFESAELESEINFETESEPLTENFGGMDLDFGATELANEVAPEIDTTTEWEETPLESISPEPVYVPPQETYKAPENFADLKKFSESSSFTGMSAEGNPSFSVLIKDVRFIEDVNDITSLLKELKLLADPEDQIKGRLMRGTLLVPRISEYAAIYLAHKLRRFDIDIQLGPSDEIHPPKHQESPETGVVSKFNLHQNQSHHFHFDDPKLELSQIIVAATPTLEGHQVLRYMGVASEHKMLDGNLVEDESSEEIPRHYQELAQKLKAHALKANANAVVGLNYQLTPIPSEYGAHGAKYRLTCTGNLVWINKL